MSQAILRTERIRLVPLADEHLEHEVELDADPEVMRYLGNGRARTREEVEVLHHERLAAARELIRHGFADLGLTRAFAETMAVNTASRATMAAVGMRHIRTFHLDFDEPIPGGHLGEVEYAITRRQWLARQAADG